MLSGIIVVALKGMYTQAGELPRFHRESKFESITWVVTFVAVVLVDVDIGYSTFNSKTESKVFK